MQQMVAMVEIKKRAEAIGLSLKKLARMAPVAPSTAYRALNQDSDPRTSTTNKMLRALQAEETRCRAHLASLPAPDGGAQA